jgi:hypothetical protein
MSDRALACTLIAAIVAFIPWTAFAQSRSCVAQGGNTLYFCDELTASSTIGTRSGGTRVTDSGREGWRADGFGNYILHDLGAQADKGILTFWVTNISMNSFLHGDDHHLVETRDLDSDQMTYLGSIRIFSDASRQDYVGRPKFEFGGWPPCGADNFSGWRDPDNWQPDHWFHIEIEFDRGWAELRIDGQVVSTLNYDVSCPVTVRYIHVPIKPRVEGAIDIVDGAVYSHVSFAGSPLGVQPQDGGFPDGGEARHRSGAVRLRHLRLRVQHVVDIG